MFTHPPSLEKAGSKEQEPPPAVEESQRGRQEDLGLDAADQLIQALADHKEEADNITASDETGDNQNDCITGAPPLAQIMPDRHDRVTDKTQCIRSKASIIDHSSPDHRSETNECEQESINASQAHSTGHNSVLVTSSTSASPLVRSSQPSAEERPTKRQRRVALPLRGCNDEADIAEHSELLPSVETERMQTVGDQTRLWRTVAVNVMDHSPTDSQPRKRTKLLMSRSVHLSKDTTTFFKGQEVTILKDTNGLPKDRSNLIHVISDDASVSTMKSLITLVSNGHVVTEAWIQDSVQENMLQDPKPYAPPAIGNTSGRNRKNVFAGWTLVFTKMAAGDALAWATLRTLACEAGAEDVIRADSEEIEDMHDTESATSRPNHNDIVLGLQLHEDGDARDLVRHGLAVYDRHLFARAIIRGRFDADQAEMKDLRLRSSSSKGSNSRN